MASSHPVITSIESRGSQVVLRFWADSEKSYSLLAGDSLSAGAWAKFADVFPAPLPRQLAFTNDALAAQTRFYRLVTPRMP